MKKLLLTMVAAFALTSYASAGEATYTFNGSESVAYGMTRLSGSTSDYNPDPFIVENGSAPTITLEGRTRLWSDGLRFYNGSTFTVNTENGNITEIVITYKNATAQEAFEFVGNASEYVASEATGTWTGEAPSVKFKYTPTSKNQAVASIKITYTGSGTTPDTRKPAGLSFPEEKYTVVMGEAFTAPVLTKETTAAVTYSSDNEKVATVNAATGAVTVVGVGLAHITAKAEANEEYKAGEASYLLTVEKALPNDLIYNSKLGEDFTFETAEGALEAWSHDSTYGLKGSAFKNGTVNATVSFAVSPVIDLNGYPEAKLNFSNAFNQYKINNELIEVSLLPQYAEIVIREEGSTEWKLLASPTLPEGFSWNFFENGEISLAEYANKKIQFGYKYISTEECAGTWEIKEITITGDKSQGVADVEAAEDAPAVYYNLQGVRVENPENGLYIKVQGKKSSKVYIK